MARKRRRLHKRYRSRNRRDDGGSPRSNPTGIGEVAEYLLPGFGGFAAARILTRLATVQIAQRKPAWAKHAGVIAAAASFGAAWWGAHRVKALEPYAAPITVGAGIAALQSVLQLWIPQIGWLVGDPLPSLAAAGADIQVPALQQVQQMKLTPVDEDPNWFTYDDKYDAGLYAKNPRGANGKPAPASSAAAKVAAEDDLLADLNLDDAGTGGFGSIFN